MAQNDCLATRAIALSQPTRHSPSSPPSPTTRVSQQTLTPLEIMSFLNEKIVDTTSAREYLDSLLLMGVGQPMTPKHLSNMVFHMLQTNGITATAFLLWEHHMSEQLNKIIQEVSKMLVSSVISAIALQVAKVPEASETLAMTATTLTASPPPTSSYKGALLSTNPLPEKHANPLPSDLACTHLALKERKILIDLNANNPHTQQNSTKDTLITMIKEALNMLGMDESPPVKLKSQSWLCNSSLVLELNSTEAAKWLLDPQGKTTFLETMEDTTIWERSYNVMIPFVPITKQLDSREALAEIEKESDIPVGSIKEAK
ncbi:hypothetical protein F5J12DRAFT_898198 [Pisolithus orientalis]|uniref:uncharacterized protein n=1 Tax=Pisolithus orientalis TaxID=936130 RepID=UPI0022249917|nr:uncharacterized protein F5J12DRAFT_898198 [Pisolithus orientalis]KAI5988470.1 hypothetical protein F5J12DRAFT_898198 [Pisolithus orientalis]